MKEVLLLVGRSVVELDRADAGSHQASVDPLSAPRIVGSWCPLSQLLAPALDPSVVVLGGPPPSVARLVLGGATRGLLGLAHLRSVDQILQRLAAKAQLA